MQFLTRAECEAYARRFGRVHELLDPRIPALRKKTDFLYDSPLAAGATIAAELVSCLGRFSSALLWSHALIFGDRTNDPGASPDWRQYGRWRRSHGAAASLYEEPGQLFARAESDALTEAILWTMRVGTDTIVIPTPTPAIIHLTHDDLISVHARSNPAGLRSLESLGLRRFERGLIPPRH